MQRVVVVGTSGSGKTTLARRLSDLLDLRMLEMDSIFHRGGWSSTPDDQFVAEVEAFVDKGRWIVDGNYTSHGAMDVVWPRADTVVWLDLPKRTVMRRVVARTLRRVVTRERLWGELTEPWTNLYKRVPEENIILWAWTTHAHNRAKYEKAVADGRWDHATVHRMRSSREVNRFVTRLERS